LHIIKIIDNLAILNYNYMEKVQLAIVNLLGSILNDNKADEKLFADNPQEFWDSFYEQAYEQCIGPLILDSIEKNGIQPPLRTKLKFIYLRDKTEQLYAIHLQTILALRKIMQSGNVRSHVIKGTDIAQLYKTPSHRKLGDIDFYVEDYSLAMKLLKANGIKVEVGTFIEKHDNVRINGVEIELHKQIVQRYPTLSSKKRYSYLKKHVGDKAKFYCMYTILHNIYHLTHTGLKMHMICDWNQYVSTYGILHILETKDELVIKYANAFNSILIHYFGLNKEHLKKEDGTYMLPSEEEQLLGEEILATCFDLKNILTIKRNGGITYINYEIAQYRHFLGFKATVNEVLWSSLNQTLHLLLKIKTTIKRIFKA